MRNKLKKAGIEPADEKLQAIGREVVAQQRNLDKAKDMLMARISSDAALMYEFTKPFHKEAARRLLAPLLAETRRAGHPSADAHGTVASSGAGQLGSDSHEFAARANQSGTDGGHALADIQRTIAPISPGTAMRTVVRLTILDTFRVTDYHRKHEVPIGDIYVQGVMQRAETAGKYAWASARERELYLMIAAAVDKQAHIPKDAKIRDVFSAKQVKQWIEMAGGTASHPDLSSFRRNLKVEAAHA